MPPQPSRPDVLTANTTKEFTSTSRYKRPTREEIEARSSNTTLPKSDQNNRPARYSSDYSVDSPIDSKPQIPEPPPNFPLEVRKSPPNRYNQPTPPSQGPARNSISQPTTNQPVYAAYPGSQQASPPRRQVSPALASPGIVRRKVAASSALPPTYPSEPALIPQGLQLPKRQEVTAEPPSPSVYGQFSPYSGPEKVASVIATSRPASSSISTPGYFPPQQDVDYTSRPGRASVSSSSYSSSQPAINSSRPTRATVSSANNLPYPGSVVPERFVGMPSSSPPPPVGGNNASRVGRSSVSTPGYPSSQPASSASLRPGRASVSSSQSNNPPYPGASTTDYFGPLSQVPPTQAPYNINGAPYAAYTPNQNPTQLPIQNQTQNMNQTQGYGYGQGPQQPQQPRPNRQQQNWNTYRG